MTLKEARERLVTGRVDLELLVDWLNATDRPDAGAEVQRDLSSLIEAINVVLRKFWRC